MNNRFALTLITAAMCVSFSLRLPAQHTAKNGDAPKNAESTQPLNFDAIAGRIVAYSGREVLVQGKLRSITQTRNGPVLTVAARGGLANVQCAEAPSGVKVNEAVALLARVPANPARQYLEFVKIYSEDEDNKPAGITEEDLARVKFDEEGEQKMLEMINAEREKEKLKPYKWNEKLQLAARKHSAEMVLKNYSSHNSLDGKTVAKRVSDEGVHYSGVGENIATSSSVRNAHKGLMDSPGHRSNIMSKDFTEIGIGIIKGIDGGVTVTQNFIYSH